MYTHTLHGVTFLMVFQVASDTSLINGNQGCCPLSWSSNKVKRKVASTLSAETFALSDALDEAVYLNAILSETLFDAKDGNLHISAFINNKYIYISSTKQVQEKQLRINIAETRRMKEQKEVNNIG